MLIFSELKRNIRFFISMAVVISLLMGAGLSLFNFAFEISRSINKELNEAFKNGYGVYVRGLITKDQNLDGVSYYKYDYSGKFLESVNGEPITINSEINPYLSIDVDTEQQFNGFGVEPYHFEDYLPKGYVSADSDFDGLLLSGRMWNSADNQSSDGVYSIFISDTVFNRAAQFGIDLSVGNVLTLSEKDVYIDGQSVQGTSRDFIVRGIYKYDEIPWSYGLAPAVIPLNAEQEYRQFTGNSIYWTTLLIDSLSDFKAFSKQAKSLGLDYSAYIEDELAFISLFSTLFAALGVTILAICAAISYVYCNMFLTRRMAFIGLIKALGLTPMRIAMQIFVLLLGCLTVAYAAATLLAYVLTSHFVHLTKTLFDMTISIGINGMSQLVFAVLTVLAAFISVLALKRRISKISISATLTQRE